MNIETARYELEQAARNYVAACKVATDADPREPVAWTHPWIWLDNGTALTWISKTQSDKFNVPIYTIPATAAVAESEGN